MKLNIIELRDMVALAVRQTVREAKKAKLPAERSEESVIAQRDRHVRGLPGYAHGNVLDMSKPLGKRNRTRRQGASNIGNWTSEAKASPFSSWEYTRSHPKGAADQIHSMDIDQNDPFQKQPSIPTDRVGGLVDSNIGKLIKDFGLRMQSLKDQVQDEETRRRLGFLEQSFNRIVQGLSGGPTKSNESRGGRAIGGLPTRGQPGMAQSGGDGQRERFIQAMLSNGLDRRLAQKIAQQAIAGDQDGLSDPSALGIRSHGVQERAVRKLVGMIVDEEIRVRR